MSDPIIDDLRARINELEARVHELESDNADLREFIGLITQKPQSKKRGRPKKPNKYGLLSRLYAEFHGIDLNAKRPQGRPQNAAIPADILNDFIASKIESARLDGSRLSLETAVNALLTDLHSRKIIALKSDSAKRKLVAAWVHTIKNYRKKLSAND